VSAFDLFHLNGEMPMFQAENETLLWEKQLPKAREAPASKADTNTFQPRSEPLSFLIVLLRALSAFNV
jgi:hypothetical protein